MAAVLMPGKGIEKSYVSDDEKAAYLSALSEGKTKKQAAEDLGRSPSTFFKMAKADVEFGELVRQAYHENGRDVLVATAWERAVDGIEEPIFNKDGEQTGSRIVRDNVLLMFLIKQRDPSFRENAKLELAGADGGRPEVKISLDFSGAIDALEQAGVIRRGPSAGGDDTAVGVGAEPAGLLPARTDGEADGCLGGA